MTRMIEAIRHARRLSRTAPLAGFVTGAELAPGPTVHGIDRLWVADASVMPTIPAANTNLTTIVIAERIAQQVSAPWSGTEAISSLLPPG
jgi:choline dehydrogenase